MTVYAEDQGTDFGTWGDATSRFMYHQVMEVDTEFRAKHFAHKRVGDYGGANGLLRRYVPDSCEVVTVDVDPLKNPDVNENVILHNGKYDIVHMRYLLHYLSDQEVLAMLDNIAAPVVYIMQFTNDQSIRDKYRNSAGSEAVKYFRGKEQLSNLLGASPRWTVCYNVSEEFYLNRLGIKNAKPHLEQVSVWTLGSV